MNSRGDIILIQDWMPMRPRWFRSSISGKLIYPFKVAYCRMVGKFLYQQYEVDFEWGDIFDVIRES